MAKVFHIQEAITQVDPKRTYQVKVLVGAPEELVQRRQLRVKYETNREIKIWSAWFLLKALTQSNKIQGWHTQRDLLTTWLQCNENTLRSLLKAMERMELVQIVNRRDVHLASWEKAADILNLPYSGTYSIPFNPFKHEGKQTFQYILRGEEIRIRQQQQLQGLVYHIDNNPLLRSDLILQMARSGADIDRLENDDQYMQEQLLKLQIKSFRHGSELGVDYIMLCRADINRCVRTMQKNHSYKGASSVSYMKRRMIELQVIQVQKICVESKVRARFYIPDDVRENGRRDGYKWNDKKGVTAWFLTDQIKLKYETDRKEKRAAKKAA